MRYRKLTNTGDYSFGNGQLDFYRDVPAAVGQSVETRILLWLGEWFLDIEDGTPFLQGILGKYSQVTANTTIQDRILTTDGVVSIENYRSNIDVDNRAMTVECDINTIFGPTALKISNYALY